MISSALIQLALNSLSCSQKELAIRLGVSPTQVSMWKKGGYMSSEMEKTIRAIANIEDMDPIFVTWAGSSEAARKWSRLINYLARAAFESAETGYDTSPLEDDSGVLCRKVAQIFSEMGIVIPREFPRDLDLDYEKYCSSCTVEIDGEEYPDEYSVNVVMDAIDGNVYSSCIIRMFESLNGVYAFYAAYVSSLVGGGFIDVDEGVGENIESHLMDLAACKIALGEDFASNFLGFKHKVKKNYLRWLTAIKNGAFRAGVPLKAELLDLVYKTSGKLGHHAEAESLGFNESRIHPDIYMNELLVGMRVIHQVLPAIMKKLGIEEEFELDDSKLRLG
ncbi:helix-turn-helix transcriptional regulator [Burkholderia contaminans]|uniref:helix-turn-helix domain-containing protein n=1 Tax=Burkholderia contaminans TaxID=488447 RepID=UPI001CF1616E|nr:helix-turn-helix transcriptional regulator [Burkholderia contaminans]MCA7890036.1 helix-turn-helix transcriptional regulator [Burkholderia contaminans]HEM7878110.1 helix-turn-helix transcriptional regulator [Burkholderia contaminans]